MTTLSESGRLPPSVVFAHRPVRAAQGLGYYRRNRHRRRGEGRHFRTAGSSPLEPSWRDHLLPATIHLSFQAFFSFMNLASPACTGTVGLAMMPFACMPTKLRAMGPKPGSALRGFAPFR